MISPDIPANEQERLSALARYEVLDTLSETEFDDITLLASSICNIPIALISLVDEKRQWFKSKVGIDATETSREISFCGHAIHQAELFEIGNALEDTRFADNPLVAGAPNIRFYAGMPLVTDDGYALGTLCVIDQIPHQLSDGQKTSLAALARQVMRLFDSRIAIKTMALLNEQVEKKSAFNQALLASASEPMLTMSDDGTIKSVNRATEKLFACAAVDLVDRANIALLFDANDIQTRADVINTSLNSHSYTCIEVLKAYLQLDMMQGQEWRCVNHLGQTISVELSLSKIKSGIDENSGFMIFMHDVSVRQYYEASLFIANNQFEASLEAMPDMVWVKNLAGEFVQCNRSFERYLGIHKNHIVGKRDVDFFDQESADFYTAKDQEAISNGFPMITEEWITFADGYHGLFEVTKTATKDREGHVLGVLSMAHDITQRKNTELKIRAHREAMQALNEIASQTANQDYKSQIREALSVACQYLGMNFGVLSHVNADEYVIELQHISNDVTLQHSFYDGIEYPVKSSYANLLMASAEVVCIENFNRPVYAKLQCATFKEFKSYIGIALEQEHQFYGGLEFFAYQARFNAFESVEIEFIKLLSRWVNNCIKRHQLLEQINIGNDRLTLALSGADLGLWDLNIQTGETVFNARWGQMLGLQLDEFSHHIDSFKKLVHPEDLERVERLLDAHLQGKTADFTAEFRMKHKAGHWVWIFDRGRVMERDAFGKPIRMVGTHMDVTERKKAEDEIRLLAFYDVLTNLPNRRLLIDRLEHALVTSARTKQHGALIFIDLDNFKTLNDTLGHDKGDALLKRVATRLLSCLRDGDTVARFGGDEFVVMLNNLDEAPQIAMNQVEIVGDKIIHSLNQAYDLSGQQYFSSPTLGATLFNGQVDNVDDSLKRADIAMYQAKNAGKNCLRFFDQHIQSNLLNKTKLADDLRLAIDAKQFTLYYQPQVDHLGMVKGAEALIRWHHPVRGLVSPLDFIPLAEETGLIIQLGNWVLETGCQQLVAWQADSQMQHFNLAINVSARQFHQPNFVEQVFETLHKTGANPHHLKLELTESMLVNDVDDVISKMSQLRVKGVSFSLDDFGTGFSSLSLLKLLPLNQLKIDKSFVRDVLTDANDAVIAKTIVALASSLGLTVIAEGVEIEGQRDFLAEHGCYDYQGYLFSKPLNIAEFEAYCKLLVKKQSSMHILGFPANETLRQNSLF